MPFLNLLDDLPPLQRSGSEASSLLVGSEPQWPVGPKNYYYYDSYYIIILGVSVSHS